MCDTHLLPWASAPAEGPVLASLPVDPLLPQPGLGEHIDHGFSGASCAPGHCLSQQARLSCALTCLKLRGCTQGRLSFFQPGQGLSALSPGQIAMNPAPPPLYSSLLFPSCCSPNLVQPSENRKDWFCDLASWPGAPPSSICCLSLWVWA